jgi:hypothetical protein
VGKWETCFWFSTFPSALAVGLCGMWESRSDFQGLWKAVCAFHQAVISTGKALFGRRFGLCFFGLLDSVAGDVQLKNDAMMHEAVNRRSCRHRIFEDAFPF